MAKPSASAPEFVKFFGPVLSALRALGGSGRPEEVRGAIAKALAISEEAQAEPLPSGVQSRFENQVHWARFYLVRAGYIDASRHGVWTLTEKASGLDTLSPQQARDIYRGTAAVFRAKAAGAPPTVESPDEQVAPVTDAADPTLALNYREEVAAKLQALPAGGFERFCQRLLRESGFEEVTVTGRSGDGGIDGIGILQVNALSASKSCFNASGIRGRCRRATSGISEAP
jgi:restriction system protein